VSEASKSEVVQMVRRFTTSRAAILILSYETFRIHEKLFHKGPNHCGLLICDEAHRLKNKETKTAKALHALATRRRILLSGTPIQNDLDEFYSMVHFCNPDLLGNEREFHKVYQNPILRGREPDATPRDREEGERKSGELGRIVNQFILRRTHRLPVWKCAPCGLAQGAAPREPAPRVQAPLGSAASHGLGSVCGTPPSGHPEARSLFARQEHAALEAPAAQARVRGVLLDERAAAADVQGLPQL
jgi:hypothetical protein